ncbi:MAG: hypothetical protein ACLGHQ_04840 [Acidimicrobiia bacterium]
MAAADGRRASGIGTSLCAVGITVALVVSACGGDEPVQQTFVGVPETVAIGGLPGALSDTTVPTLPEVSLATTTTTTQPEREPISGPLVDEVLDHRVLLVGDTALAATTPRAGGIMCDILTGFGWDIEVEAEPGRPIDFAVEVLDELLDDPDGWDVVGLMFGHHVPDSVDDFERTLDGLLERLAPTPVMLHTVAELGDEQVEVNRLLRERERSWPNVVIVDWAAAAEAEPDVLLDDGGPVPSEEGAGRLALFTAALLSDVPGDDLGT